PLGVQQHAVDAQHPEAAVVAAIAMAGVADEVVRQVLEVAADLAEAPGLRPGAQQRIARGLESGGRDWQLSGGQALEAGLGGLFLRLAGAAVERVVDGELLVRRPAAADREIALVDLAGHPRLAQLQGGITIEGQQQAAAGGAVEAVRSEERRVGRGCRSRRGREHSKMGIWRVSM